MHRGGGATCCRFCYLVMAAAVLGLWCPVRSACLEAVHCMLGCWARVRLLQRGVRTQHYRDIICTMEQWLAPAAYQHTIHQDKSPKKHPKRRNLKKLKPQTAEPTADGHCGFCGLEIGIKIGLYHYSALRDCNFHSFLKKNVLSHQQLASGPPAMISSSLSAGSQRSWCSHAASPQTQVPPLPL